MASPIRVKTRFDSAIAELAAHTDPTTLTAWACDCAERVRPYFEHCFPRDARPRRAIEAGRAWVRTGLFKMADIRKASLDSHAAAREAREGSPARSAARAAGQAVAAAHVSGHAIEAALYAATAVRDGNEATDAILTATREREWQHRHLLELLGRTS